MASIKDLHDFAAFFEIDFMAHSDPGKYNCARNLGPVGATSKSNCAINNQMQEKKCFISIHL